VVLPVTRRRVVAPQALIRRSSFQARQAAPEIGYAVSGRAAVSLAMANAAIAAGHPRGLEVSLRVHRNAPQSGPA
jgi:hypothetical protein